MDKTYVTKYFSQEIKQIFEKVQDFGDITEIRLRAEKPILVNTHTREYTLTEQGTFTKELNQGFLVKRQDISKTIELISNFSMYSFEKEIKNGYITIPGGHRVGITGTTIVQDGQIKTMKDFNSINIRVAKQVFGAGNKILPYVMDENIGIPRHTLIISPPLCGKTTMLRDIIRKLSYGWENQKGISVGVVDERKEIAASYMGVPQNDLGPRTDVLDSCPKSLGMIILLRAMSPKVIAVDELGSTDDISAVETIINSGVSVIATAHGKSMEDIKLRKNLKNITSKKLFDRYIVLDAKKVGQIENVYNKSFDVIANGNSAKHSHSDLN